MVSITLSVPEDIRKLMKEHPERNWSGFVRQCIVNESKKLSWKEEMLKKLASNEEREFIDWSVELGKKAKRGRLKRLKNEGD